VMYLNGLGVSADREKAREWLQRAALHLNTGAKQWLSEMDAKTPPTSIQSTSTMLGNVARSTGADDAEDLHNTQAKHGAADFR